LIDFQLDYFNYIQTIFRLKEALPNFCIFLSGNESNRVVHDKNSISILTSSCAKSNCNLEFELKIKGQQLTIKMQMEDSDEDEDELADLIIKKKYKFEIIIFHFIIYIKILNNYY